MIVKLFIIVAISLCYYDRSFGRAEVRNIVTRVDEEIRVNIRNATVVYKNDKRQCPSFDIKNGTDDRCVFEDRYIFGDVGNNGVFIKNSIVLDDAGQYVAISRDHGEIVIINLIVLEFHNRTCVIEERNADDNRNDTMIHFAGTCRYDVNVDLTKFGLDENFVLFSNHTSYIFDSCDGVSQTEQMEFYLTKSGDNVFYEQFNFSAPQVLQEKNYSLTIYVDHQIDLTYGGDSIYNRSVVYAFPFRSKRNEFTIDSCIDSSITSVPILYWYNDGRTIVLLTMLFIIVVLSFIVVVTMRKEKRNRQCCA